MDPWGLHRIADCRENGITRQTVWKSIIYISHWNKGKTPHSERPTMFSKEMVNSSSIRTLTSHLDKNWNFFYMDSPGLCQFLESSWEPQWGLVTPQQKTSPYPPSREIFLLAICHQKPDLSVHLGPSLCISCSLSLLPLWFWCLLPCRCHAPPNPIPGVPLPTAPPCSKHSWKCSCMGTSCTLWLCKVDSIFTHLTWSGQICSCKLPICLSLVQQLSTGSFKSKNPQLS